MSAADLSAAVIARLADQVDAFGGRIEDAAALAELIQRGIVPQRTPAAWVLAIGDDAEANAMATMALRQRVTETIGVVTIHRHAGDAAGGRARAGLEPVRAAVRTALTGWRPVVDGLAADAFDPFEFVRGRLQGLQAGCVFWQLDFRTRWILSA